MPGGRHCKVSADQIWAAMKARENHFASACFDLGFSPETIKKRMKVLKAQGAEVPELESHRTYTATEYRPSRKEIRRVCKEIRATWTASERQRRNVYWRGRFEVLRSRWMGGDTGYFE